jgi:hypothetical protein
VIVSSINFFGAKLFNMTVKLDHIRYEVAQFVQFYQVFSFAKVDLAIMCPLEQDVEESRLDIRRFDNP